MPIECKLVKKVSKNNNEYYCLFIPDIEKTIFLEPSELKLLLLLHKEVK